MLGIGLERGGEPENLVAADLPERDHLGEVGGAVGERAGLVEDPRPAGGEPFEDRRIADDDPAPGRQRHRTDDRHWDPDQQRAGGGDDEDSEKSRGIAAAPPRRAGHGQRQRRVKGAEGVGKPAEARTMLLARPEDIDDPGITAVASHARGADVERPLAVDGP